MYCIKGRPCRSVQGRREQRYDGHISRCTDEILTFMVVCQSGGQEDEVIGKPYLGSQSQSQPPRDQGGQCLNQRPDTPPRPHTGDPDSSLHPPASSASAPGCRRSQGAIINRRRSPATISKGRADPGDHTDHVSTHNTVGETVSCVVAIDAAGVRLPYSVFIFVFGFARATTIVPVPLLLLLSEQTRRRRRSIW